MRCMVLGRFPEGLAEPPKAFWDAFHPEIQRALAAGVIKDGSPLAPTARATRVRVAKGKTKVTDGPFTESKEMIAGYGIYEVKSRAEAVEWTERFAQLHIKYWPGWEGEFEVREMVDNPKP